MEMWFGGLVVWLFCCLVVWLSGGLVVWQFGGLVDSQSTSESYIQPTPHDLAGSQYRAQRE